MSGPKFPILEFIPSFDLQSNANTLSKVMRDERAAHALCGYRFIFSEDEQSEHKRASTKFKTACYDFVRMARNDRKPYRLFRNMNGELAVKLCEEN